MAICRVMAFGVTSAVAGAGISSEKAAYLLVLGFRGKRGEGRWGIPGPMALARAA